MDHLRFFLYILLLAPGFAGLTVTAILRHRLRERLLSVVLVIIAAFTFGLVLFVLSFYIEVIAGLRVELGVVTSLLNFAVVLVMYGGIISILWRIDTERPLWLPVLIAIPVVASYLLFGILPASIPGLAAWGESHDTLVSLLSVGAASLFLGYSGWRLQAAAKSLDHPSVRFLFRSLGWMLLGFAVLAVVTTALAEALDVDLAPTAFLNFVLYLAWNITAVLGFVRYLTHPVDVFADAGVPASALERYGISPREAEVILQLSRGLSNKEIAERLNVSFTTVRTHVYNVFKKTGAASRVELLRILSSG